MHIQERNAKINRLKEIKKRATKGIHTHEDYRTIVDILIKLTKDVKID